MECLIARIKFKWSKPRLRMVITETLAEETESLEKKPKEIK